MSQDKNLTFEEEPIAILNRQVRKLRSKEIVSVKVQWRHHPVAGSTWEVESNIRSRYPYFFDSLGTLFLFTFEDEHLF